MLRLTLRTNLPTNRRPRGTYCCLLNHAMENLLLAEPIVTGREKGRRTIALERIHPGDRYATHWPERSTLFRMGEHALII